MPKSYVFVGPTISIEECRKVFDAEYLGPVKCEDVCTLALECDRPFAIGIIDGLFERVPAVFHKEILFAITRGIHVFGASSMGALRAAELDSFGMKGVGEVYQAIKAGILTDDDEVTVTHADKEFGYKPLSESMVNIRASLHRAWEDAAITTQTRDKLVNFAKSLYYPDRTAASIKAEAPLMERDDVMFYLRGGGRVDQKKLDAVEMLKAMKRCAEQGDPPPPHNFSLELTNSLEKMIYECRTGTI